MTTQQSEIAATVRDTPQGPGRLLAQARTDLRLTPEEAAARLHLSTPQIQSLEADNYADLPGTTYVRGYLRSYAILLGLDVDTVLKAHAQLTATPASPDFSTIAPPRQITSHHHQIRFVTYVVAILVIGLALAWWQSRDANVASPLPVMSTEQTGAVLPAEEASVTELPPATAAPKPAIALAPPPLVNPAATAAAPPVVIATLPPVARVRFILHADQEAWVDIRDARQNKLLYETVSAGRRVALEGVAPFSIFLGNAAATRIEFDGQPVDIERHRRGVFARFTLGDNSAAPAR